VVLYSGSLLPGKGLGHVLDAIAELQGQRPDLFFVLVGYPVDEVRTQLETRGLVDLVRLVGRVPYDELPRWLAVADIALEPKEEVSGEASGKVLHYLAAGLPVVCFDTVNNRELLGEMGYYARANGPSFAAAILQAADDPAGRQARGRAGREAVARTHSLAGIRTILTSWYGRLRHRGTSGG
jgi:glycosyltransferase involved in cell wall biosynthesis